MMKLLKTGCGSFTVICLIRRPDNPYYPFRYPKNIECHKNEVAIMLCGAPIEWNSLVLKISYLMSDYRLLDTFVCHNIEPRDHIFYLIYPQTFLLYSLGTSDAIGIPKTILDSMVRIYDELRKLILPFGAMIYKILIEADFQAYKHEVPVSCRQKINGRTKSMSDTHVLGRIQGKQS